MPRRREQAVLVEHPRNRRTLRVVRVRGCALAVRGCKSRLSATAAGDARSWSVRVPSDTLIPVPEAILDSITPVPVSVAAVNSAMPAPFPWASTAPLVFSTPAQRFPSSLSCSTASNGRRAHHGKDHLQRLHARSTPGTDMRGRHARAERCTQGEGSKEPTGRGDRRSSATARKRADAARSLCSTHHREEVAPFGWRAAVVLRRRCTTGCCSAHGDADAGREVAAPHTVDTSMTARTTSWGASSYRLQRKAAGLLVGPEHICFLSVRGAGSDGGRCARG